MGCGFGNLVDEVTEIGVVQLYVFVDVGEGEGMLQEPLPEGGWGWVGAAEDVGEGLEEFGEESTARMLSASGMAARGLRVYY